MTPALSRALFAILILTWGTTWAAIRIGLEGVPPLTGVSLRFALASALLLVIALVRRVPLGRRPIERRLWVANGLLSFVVTYGVVYWSEQYVPSGLAAVLFATYPIFLGLVATLLLPGERLGRGGWLGLLVAFAGVATIFSEDLDALAGPGVALAGVVMLLSPLSSAFGSALVKRYGAGIHPLSLTAPPMALCALVTGALALVFESDASIVFDARSVGAIVYLAVFGSALTFGVYYWLLQHHEATKVGLIAYLVPVVAVLVGTLLLDEPLSARIALGAGLVVAGTALASRRRAPRIGPLEGREREG